MNILVPLRFGHPIWYRYLLWPRDMVRLGKGHADILHDHTTTKNRNRSRLGASIGYSQRKEVSTFPLDAHGFM